MARKRVSDDDREVIKKLYTKGLLSLQEIGKRLGLSGQTVGTVLYKMDVNTSKKKIVVPCDSCGKLVVKTRAEVRNHAQHFCNPECYSTWLRDPDVQEQLRRHEFLKSEAALKFGFYDCAVHENEDGRIFVFRDKETLLLWKRTGLPQEVVTNNGKVVTATFANGKGRIV